MSADALAKILVSVLVLLGAIATPAAAIIREFVKYLFRRIDVLEEREAAVLVASAASIKQQGEELSAQGALIRELAKQEERRKWLHEQGGKE